MPFSLGALVANWKAILVVSLLTAFAVQTWRVGNLKDAVDACQSRNLAQVSEWRAKYAEAVTAATAAKAATEAAQAKISSEVGNDTQKRLDALRSALAGVVRQSKANSGSTAGAYLPSTTEAARSLDVAADATVMADAQHCGESFLIASGWQRWWREVSQIDRSN